MAVKKIPNGYYFLRLILSSSRASRHSGQQLDAREDDPLHWDGY